MIYKLTSVNTEELIAPDGEVVELPLASNTSFKIFGPLLPVNISDSEKISEQLQTHDKQSKIFTCKALIDTGASMSVISPKVVEELGLPGIGIQTIASVHSVELRPVYFGRITFPWALEWKFPLYVVSYRDMIA